MRHAIAQTLSFIALAILIGCYVDDGNCPPVQPSTPVAAGGEATVGVGVQATGTVQTTQPTGPATVTVFGSTQPIEGALRGNIFALPEGTARLPDFAQMPSIGTIYASSIDIAARSFDSGFPGVTDRFEWFGIRYEGTVNITTGGSYGFRVVSDDGARLTIDGQVVVDNDGVHPPTSRAGQVVLQPGAHRIMLDYFQGPRVQIALQLFWTPPGGQEQVFAVR